MSFFLFNLLNGMQLSMLLFLMAIGFTITFGLMNILNLAHGAFYMVGAYMGYMVGSLTGSFWLALLLAPLIPMVLGFLLQYLVLQPLVDRGRDIHLDMALLTFGLLFFVVGVAELVSIEILHITFASIRKPALLAGYVNIGLPYPSFRLFIIGLGIAVGLLVWLLLERTIIGAVVRGGVDDQETVRTMGIDVHLVFAGVFAFGCWLAGISGVVAGAELSIDSSMAASILVPTLIVVVLGGLGSVKGCFIGAIVVGMTQTLTQAYAPAIAAYSIYILLTLILVVRPQGIFGRAPGAA